MKITLFSVDEANRLAQEIRPALERLILVKREFNQLQSRADVLSLALAGAAQSNPDAQEMRQVQDRRTLLAEQLAQGVQAIQRRGCVVKDLDSGLIDFYTLSGDRLIFLCWKLGEPEVGHWHSIEGGYLERRPLDRSERE